MPGFLLLLMSHFCPVFPKQNLPIKLKETRSLLKAQGLAEEGKTTSKRLSYLPLQQETASPRKGAPTQPPPPFFCQLDSQSIWFLHRYDPAFQIRLSFSLLILD